MHVMQPYFLVTSFKRNHLMLFRNIILIACITAIISGFILGSMQSFSTTNIIYSAEQFEVTDHEHAAVNEHVTEEWGPQDGLERVGYTYLADVLIAFGHSLLLTSFMAFIYLKFGKPEISWRSGLIIGMGGYLSFYLSTVIGLPPEIPGSLAADLHARQIWWSLTVLATIIGLTTFYLAPAKLKIAGIVFIVMPHIIGAPHPDVHGFVNEDASALTALSNLEQAFMLSTAWVNLVYWLILGAVSGLFAKFFLKINLSK